MAFPWTRRSWIASICATQSTMRCSRRSASWLRSEKTLRRSWISGVAQVREFNNARTWLLLNSAVLGIWCIDVADEYPSAEVCFPAADTWHFTYSYRLSAWTLHPHSQTGNFNILYPNFDWPLTNPRVPPNCRFELDDMERPWMWKENSFDFIFSRDLVLAIRDFPKLIDQCYTSVPQPSTPFLKNQLTSTGT